MLSVYAVILFWYAEKSIVRSANMQEGSSLTDEIVRTSGRGNRNRVQSDPRSVFIIVRMRKYRKLKAGTFRVVHWGLARLIGVMCYS